jgi:hypothetical protein
VAKPVGFGGLLSSLGLLGSQTFKQSNHLWLAGKVRSRARDMKR